MGGWGEISFLFVGKTVWIFFSSHRCAEATRSVVAVTGKQNQNLITPQFLFINWL